jgi:hypothetical protein
MAIQVILCATQEDEQKITPKLQERFKESNLAGLLFLTQFIPEGEPYFEVKDENGKEIYHNSEIVRFNPKDAPEEIRLVLGVIREYREKPA